MDEFDRGPWVLTKTGVKFYALDPRPEDVDIEDIAAGISKACRFNGQLKAGLDDKIYSVAQHSVYVARLVEMIGHHTAAFWGLMHDSAEAYYGDMVSPMKSVIPEFEVMEAKGAAAIRERFSIPFDDGIDHTVGIADALLAVVESVELTSIPASMWKVPREAPFDIHALDPHFHLWGPGKAREEFLKTFNNYA